MASLATARNKPGYRRGARHREIIRQILLAHPPLAKPLDWRAIDALLRERRIRLACSTINWHVAQIRLEYELEALRRTDGC